MRAHGALGVVGGEGRELQLCVHVLVQDEPFVWCATSSKAAKSDMGAYVRYLTMSSARGTLPYDIGYGIGYDIPRNVVRHLA